jgi:hypothetical protein
LLQNFREHLVLIDVLGAETILQVVLEVTEKLIRGLGLGIVKDWGDFIVEGPH